jgi:hypothetical protein
MLCQLMIVTALRPLRSLTKIEHRLYGRACFIADDHPFTPLEEIQELRTE